MIGYKASTGAGSPFGYHISTSLIFADKARSKGNMGLTASIYTTQDVLVHATAWSYNSTSSSKHSVGTNYVTPSGKVYKSGGYARVYNSKGVAQDKKLKSAYTPYSLISEDEQKERDALYETFGLIPAQATNGSIGYIYEKELLGEAPESPEEAIRIQESRNLDDFRSISVYDKDAKTIIGEFRIDG